MSIPLHERHARTEILLGAAGLQMLRGKKVLLAGLGGVGSFAAEALARSGIGHLVLVDCDVVAASNLNRQLVALESTIGQSKATIMRARIADIDPECRVDAREVFLGHDDMPNLIAEGFDAVVDAIDSLNSKATLVEMAVKAGIPTYSSMGAGGKLDPTQIRSGDLMDSEACGLARMMRKRLRKRGIERGVHAVWSLEAGRPPLPPEPTERGRPRAVNGTISHLPALFGITLAGLVIRDLVQQIEPVPSAAQSQKSK
jgi:tRNA A37 threonylcarbamoyladenosine dehydratase